MYLNWHLLRIQTTTFLSLGAEMRNVNYHLSLWFLLLAAISFIGNIAMGVGFGVGGCRLTRKLRVLVFDRFMRFSMGMSFNHELSFLCIV